ncbi:MAG TPA: hypothetical protein VLU92_03500 [Candidatus Dormibacteraeota bacterium]|nr:hypothetical protein [Candidatus Dormibacteraeota bacterium]
MSRLVERFGKTGFAAVASLIWALPMAAWAGSADLTPIDTTAFPRVALGLGVVMLIVWLVLIGRLGHLQASARPHRLDLGHMSASEKRWTLALAAFATGLIAWLNGAATVDWSPLDAAVQAGKPGAILFGGALAAFLVIMVTGTWISWRRWGRAFQRRRSWTVLE